MGVLDVGGWIIEYGCIIVKMFVYLCFVYMLVIVGVDVVLLVVLLLDCDLLMGVGSDLMLCLWVIDIGDSCVN